MCQVWGKHKEQTLPKPSQSLQFNEDNYMKEMYSPNSEEWG